MRLTRSELEIMETLWAADRPLPRSEIIELSPDRTWSVTTIHILLNSLLQKGAIQEAGFVKRNKTYGRLYSPAISGEEYYAKSVFRQKDGILMYFSALLQCDTITVDLVKQMEEMLAQKKEELLEEENTDSVT